MKAILLLQPKETKILPQLKQVFSRPYTQAQYKKGSLLVAVYTLNPFWKMLFPKMISRLKDRYDELFFDETMAAYRHHADRLSASDSFFRRFPEILDCFSTGDFLKVTVICAERDNRLLTVLEALCKHVKAVTVFTEDVRFFDEISQEAMHSFGLSLTLQEHQQKGSPDLTILLSQKDSAKIYGNYVINLSEQLCEPTGNLLTDFCSESVSAFLDSFPKIRLKSCYLVSPTEPIRNLIWKISKKS